MYLKNFYNNWHLTANEIFKENSFKKILFNSKEELVILLCNNKIHVFTNLSDFSCLFKLRIAEAGFGFGYILTNNKIFYKYNGMIYENFYKRLSNY